MNRRVEETFAQRPEGVRVERLERGYTLLASEVAEWWRCSQVLEQAILAIIRDSSEEEKDG